LEYNISCRTSQSNDQPPSDSPTQVHQQLPNFLLKRKQIHWLLCFMTFCSHFFKQKSRELTFQAFHQVPWQDYLIIYYFQSCYQLRKKIHPWWFTRHYFASWNLSQRTIHLPVLFMKFFLRIIRPYKRIYCCCHMDKWYVGEYEVNILSVLH
jgi:hypothetical protein